MKTKNEVSQFHSNGKLLLTAEFLIIDGATALALPCRFGQKLKVVPIKESKIHWKSFDNEKRLWFDGSFDLLDKGTVEYSVTNPPDGKSKEVADRLVQIFTVIGQLNPMLFKNGGYEMTTHLEFPRDWGLGSSSTLLVNLAQWASVNPYELSYKTFGGSGYDIACGANDQPLLFTQSDDRFAPRVKQVEFAPLFKDHLFFVHRNQKQNTRTVVKHYRSINPGSKQKWIAEATQLTEAFVSSENLKKFKELIEKHEQLLAEVLEIPPVKESHFPEFKGALKSLGAWGGDFMLATGQTAEKEFFRERGYRTILDYKDMVL